jgi:DNA repair protein RadC
LTYPSVSFGKIPVPSVQKQCVLVFLLFANGQKCKGFLTVWRLAIMTSSVNFKGMSKKELVAFLEEIHCCEGKPDVRVSRDVASIFHGKIGFKNKQEHFLAMYLDGANKVIETRIIFIGTLNKSMVHPREVFAPAFELRAASLIIGHNHPSGNIEPSIEDLHMTKKLKEAGEILGIEILDHVIFTDTNHYSFQANGKI